RRRSANAAATPMSPSRSRSPVSSRPSSSSWTRRLTADHYPLRSERESRSSSREDRSSEARTAKGEGRMSPRAAAPRVLVIDDHAPIRLTLCETLSDAGYAVTEACDGAEGVEMLRNARADAV